MPGVEGKVVLITGASSGIGYGTAKVLGEAGARLVLGARREGRLDDLVEDITKSGGTARARKLDVTDLHNVRQFVDFAKSEFGHVDVIVNNAGVMPLSPLNKLKIDEWNWMIDVNIRGVLHGIAAVLPDMNAQGFGHIINVSSVGGFIVQPTGAVYSATKFAVRAISEGLRKENDKIRCTCVYPGVVYSELANTISDERARARMENYRAIGIEPEAIGQAIKYAIEQPADVDVNELVVRPTRTQT
jgi:NADP-dependent 3-hydroxy acid dehydrogenase YdfG